MYRGTNLLAVLLVAVAAAGRPAAGPRTVQKTFTDDAIGAPPPGFVFVSTRQASPGRWFVQREGDERFLMHPPVSGSGGYALALLQDLQYQDLTLAVRLKLVGGHGSGGFVWRYRDPENFYMARLELQEQEMGLYRIVHGNRIRIDHKEDLELDPYAWHVLKVVHSGDRIRLYLGGIKVFDDKDRTFPVAGGLGLWATGDSAAYFDNVVIEEQAGSKP